MLVKIPLRKTLSCITQKLPSHPALSTLSNNLAFKKFAFNYPVPGQAHQASSFKSQVAIRARDDLADFVSHFLPLTIYITYLGGCSHFGGTPLQNKLSQKIKMAVLMLVLWPVKCSILVHDWIHRSARSPLFPVLEWVGSEHERRMSWILTDGENAQCCLQHS